MYFCGMTDQPTKQIIYEMLVVIQNLHQMFQPSIFNSSQEFTFPNSVPNGRTDISNYKVASL